MMYRNLLAMETEELLRSYPGRRRVLMGGCDKTTPALMMGAISMNLPAIFMPAGPMLRGDWQGKIARLRHRHLEILGGAARRQHHRGGLAGRRGRHRALARPLHDDGHGLDDDSSAAEALGLTLPGAASIPAPDSRHAQMASATGKRIVEMVWEDSEAVGHPRRDASFDNAVTTVLALGGSTNAIVHLDRDGAPRRRAARPRALRRARAQDAGARQHPPVGRST